MIPPWNICIIGTVSLVFHHVSLSVGFVDHNNYDNGCTRCNYHRTLFTLLWLYKEIAILFYLHFIINFSCVRCRTTLSWLVSFVIFALYSIMFVVLIEFFFSRTSLVLLIYMRWFWSLNWLKIEEKRAGNVLWTSLIDTAVHAASRLQLLCYCFSLFFLWP